MDDMDEEQNMEMEKEDIEGFQEKQEAEKDLADFIKRMKECSSEIGNEQSFVVIKNMNYIKNNSGIVVGDHVDVEDVLIHEGKEEDYNQGIEIKCKSGENILEEEEKLIQWLTEHYKDFEMAFLISLAVFEKSPYLWVYDLAEELFDRMAADTEGGQQEKEKVPNKQRLETMGAGIYYSAIHNHTGLVETEFISFLRPEYGVRVLKCIWKEFIFFRKTLVSWLEEYVFYDNYSKRNKAVNALTNLALMDYYYFDSNVIRSLMGRKNLVADYTVAQIMVRSYADERYRKNIEAQLAHWATVGNIHYSLTALLMCIMGNWEQERVQLAVGIYIKRLMCEVQSCRYSGYTDNLGTFFVIGERKAVYFKAIVSVLYENLQAYSERKYREEKWCIGMIFFLLLQIDYDESHIDVVNTKKNKDMIFVKMCFIKNDLTPKLLELWKFVWKNREFHRFTKNLLEQYLYQYGGCNERQIQYLRQFLYSFQDSEADRNAMEFFLKKISLKNRHPVRTAERINCQPEESK